MRRFSSMTPAVGRGAWLGIGAFACGLVVWAGMAGAAVGQTVGDAETEQATTTQMTLQLDTVEPIVIRTKFLDAPPTIAIEFPRNRVASSLPEHSTIGPGVIRSVAAHYSLERLESGAPAGRFLQGLDIILSGPYAYTIASEAGRIVVSVTHPASVDGTAVAVALRGGTIIKGFGSPALSGRFRAMQEALAKASPAPWPVSSESGAARVVRTAPLSASAPRATLPSAALPPRGIPEAVQPLASKARPPARLEAARRTIPKPVGWVLALIASLLTVWVVQRFARRASHLAASRSAAAAPAERLPAGVVLIDQLVWRAFQRQGYALVSESELSRPLPGIFRVVEKDGAKAGLCFIGHEAFFEKQTVQQFIQVLRAAGMERGILIASGSFTVPAARIAKEHAITLIGREQLSELISAGAITEYVSRQLGEQQARLEEAKSSLQQYARDVDGLRRQRNEASWFLGEERARSAQLEARVQELSGQLQQHEAEIRRWQQDASTLQKQWEESQWYLGESQARAKYLEAQLAALQDASQRLEVVESERSEARWYLEEERVRSESLEAQLAELQRRFEESAAREQTLRTGIEVLRDELEHLRRYGERRKGARVKVAQAEVELQTEDAPAVRGWVRDLSETGVGIESDAQWPANASGRIRLCLPGADPIESAAQLMWQRSAESPALRYQSGYQWVGGSDALRRFIEQILTKSSSA